MRHLIPFVLLSVLLALSCYWDAEDYVDSGIAKADKGDYAGALVDFEKAIELDPNYAEAYSNRGTVKFKRGDFYGAIQDNNKAIELNPDYTEAYYNRGQSLNSVNTKKHCRILIRL